MKITRIDYGLAYGLNRIYISIKIQKNKNVERTEFLWHFSFSQVDCISHGMFLTNRRISRSIEVKVMSEEAKKVLLTWLGVMANQNNECLQNMMEAEICDDTEENEDGLDDMDIYTVDKIEYYDVEKYYDDQTYQDMKSGKKMSNHSFLHIISKAFLPSALCKCK